MNPHPTLFCNNRRRESPLNPLFAQLSNLLQSTRLVKSEHLYRIEKPAKASRVPPANQLLIVLYVPLVIMAVVVSLIKALFI